MEKEKFLMTLTPELKEKLQRQADERALTITAYVRMILLEATEKADKLKKE